MPYAFEGQGGGGSALSPNPLNSINVTMLTCPLYGIFPEIWNPPGYTLNGGWQQTAPGEYMKISGNTCYIATEQSDISAPLTCGVVCGWGLASLPTDAMIAAHPEIYPYNRYWRVGEWVVSATIITPLSAYRVGQLDTLPWMSAQISAKANWFGVGPRTTTQDYTFTWSPTLSVANLDPNWLDPGAFIWHYNNLTGLYLVCTRNPAIDNSLGDPPGVPGGTVNVALIGWTQGTDGLWRPTVKGVSATPATIPEMDSAETFMVDASGFVTAYTANELNYEYMGDLPCPAGMGTFGSVDYRDSLASMAGGPLSGGISFSSMDIINITGPGMGYFRMWWLQGHGSGSQMIWGPTAAGGGIVKLNPGGISLAGTSRLPMGIIPAGV